LLSVVPVTQLALLRRREELLEAARKAEAAAKKRKVVPPTPPPAINAQPDPRQANDNKAEPSSDLSGLNPHLGPIRN
jgi:hypothetical protein